MAGSIHSSAIVHPSAEIGADVTIGPYCVIGPEVTIGARTCLLHHVSIMKKTTLGEGNTSYPGVVLGADPQDKKFVGEETWLYIGNNNTFREHVTVNRGTGLGGGKTQIGDESRRGQG